MIRERKNPGKKIAAWLQAAMAILYLGSGFFLIFSEKAALMLSEDMLPWVSAALLFYGLFRALRAWNQLKPDRPLWKN
jgi:ABC-type nickel/cobalt efflux system permease component RcnA